MFSSVTGNDRIIFMIGTCKRLPTAFPDGIGFPCLSFIDVISLVQCRPLPHLPHIPKGWVLLSLPFSEKTLFLGIHCIQSLLRCPILPQLKHFEFWCLLLPLEIASPTQDYQYDSQVSQHSCYARPIPPLVLIWSLMVQGYFCILIWHSH